MSITLALTFTAVRDARATAVLGFVEQIPALSDGAAAEADVGLERQGRFLVLRVKLSDALISAASLDRLQFWCARAGGNASGAFASGVASRFEGFMREAAFAWRGVDATKLGELLRPMLVERCGASSLSQEPEIPPVLRLQVGGPGWAGVHYDREGHALFVPTPLAPAVGDSLVLQLEPLARGHGAVRAPARVTAAFVRDAAQKVMVGFTATLEGDFAAADRVLSSTCPAAHPSEYRRAAQRVPVSAPVGVAGGEATLVNISGGGAFIRTGDAKGVGDDVQVDVRLPNDVTLSTTATVAHANEEGMGVRFQLDEHAKSALATVMTSITARPPQVLVVDDDAFARKMLTYAFKKGGWDVVTAPDADFAMHTLVDQILTLDLLVTDIVMPGVDGEELVRRIRRIGGEADLPIVVISAQVDAAVEARMQAAGADAVLSKTLGAENLVRAATEVVLRRRGEAVDQEDSAAGQPPAQLGTAIP